jgi:hypothetical protein
MSKMPASFYGGGGGEVGGRVLDERLAAEEARVVYETVAWAERPVASYTTRWAVSTRVMSPGHGDEARLIT